MNKIKNLGFTLVELLGVIIILGVIALITFPIIDKAIKNSKQKALEQIINNIEEAAYNYSIENDLGYSEYQKKLELSDLIQQGYLTKDIINPLTNNQLQGCVLYKWVESKKQYEFTYDEECEIQDTEPIVTIAYDSSLINSNGWAKENVPVTIFGNGDAKYCINTKECEPNEVIETGNNTKFITNEGSNYVCGIVSNSLGSSEKKCIEILLDKTAPTDSWLEIEGTEGENGWYISDVNIIGADGYDSISGVATATSNINLINYDTTSQEVIVTVTDNAGNTANFTHTIKVDKTPPDVGLSEFNASTEVSIWMSNEDSGLKEFMYDAENYIYYDVTINSDPVCRENYEEDRNNVCNTSLYKVNSTPYTIIEQNDKFLIKFNIYLIEKPTNPGTYFVNITIYDNAGNASTASVSYYITSGGGGGGDDIIEDDEVPL